MNRQIIEGDARLMLDASAFVAVVANFVEQHIQQRAFEGPDLLNDWQLSGLMKGLRLTALELGSRGEVLTGIADEAEEAERTRAVRQHRPCESTLGSTNERTPS
ncbi:hypothetical protein IR009_12375 [Pseudomonas putida]|uniref:hypothetical protein n=1 Tax=Pseudomonas putida TaxID=303 RepID=UPI0018AACF97|nr:hypothetical protein [Pseudomonas putida]MBF8766019.1 hypothetical protein [Pseudomonas putida]